MSDTSLYKEEHKKRHIELHRALDELATDYWVQHGDKGPSNTTVLELMAWSVIQTQNPNGNAIGNH